MSRLCALAALLVSPALAALPRVALDVPLTPVVSAPGAAALGGASAGTLALSPALAPAFAAAPALSAPAAAPAASPTASAPPAAAAPSAAAAAPSAAPAAAPPSPAVRPRVAAETDAVSVRESLFSNAPLAADLAALPAQSAAPALERNFFAAAALEGPAAVPAGAAAARAGAETSPLLDRLLSRVAIDDGGAPAQGAALRRALARMLESPTARALAERYVAEGAPAVVRFADVGPTQPTVVDGRAYFHGTRAITDWTGDAVVVRVNPAYMASDEHYREQGLPSILAHELLGHGLWYARAARENVLQAFHHHELNETNARLVGWLVDFELDRRFEEAGAWTYLRDPQAYLNDLKLRLPYYALTFSNAELQRPVETLTARLAAARAARARLETERANQRTWQAVIDHFVASHGEPAERFRVLRAQLAESDAVYADQLATVDALIKEVGDVLGRFKAETDGKSEQYLRGAAAHPLFAELQREADASLSNLLEHVRASDASAHDETPSSSRDREEYWRGQIDFEGLKKMYLDDRAKNPKHWL